MRNQIFTVDLIEPGKKGEFSVQVFALGVNSWISRNCFLRFIFTDRIYLSRSRGNWSHFPPLVFAWWFSLAIEGVNYVTNSLPLGNHSLTLCLRAWNNTFSWKFMQIVVENTWDAKVWTLRLHQSNGSYRVLVHVISQSNVIRIDIMP